MIGGVLLKKSGGHYKAAEDVLPAEADSWIVLRIILEWNGRLSDRIGEMWEGGGGCYF